MNDTNQKPTHVIACADAWLRDAGQPTYSDLLAKLERSMTTTHTQPAGCDLDSLEALDLATTPGPWAYGDAYADNGSWSHFRIVGEDGYVIFDEETGPGKNDAAFIVSAKNAMPSLIAAARAAQAPQGDTRQGAPVALLDDLESAIAGWGGDLVERVDAIIKKHRPMPDCGACPGDGSICKTKCRHRAENPPAAATTASASEPPKMSIDEAREYLVEFMEQHFTDKTFHRYIRADRVDRSRLAGDFAWQMARALRMLDSRTPSRAADGQQDYEVAIEKLASRWKERAVRAEATLAQQGASRAAHCSVCQNLEAQLRAVVKQRDDAITHQGASRAALSGEEMFNIAAPYFAWNADSWHKATQATITMQGLLNYTRAVTDAALARAPLPAQADGQAVDDARLEVFIDWYLRGGEYAEINPNGHMVRTAREQILEWLDRAAQSRAQSDTTGDRHG